MSQKERTVCDPNCHANPKCGLVATLANGKIESIEPAQYPVPGYENRICMMGLSRLEYQYHPDRLRRPLKRVGKRGAGQWQAIGWDEAIELFVSKRDQIAEAYGPRSIVYTTISGAFGLLTRGSPMRYAALTGATVMRASGIDFGIAKGLEYMFSVPADTYFSRGGHSLDDAVNSDLVLIWGANPAVTRSVDHVPLKKARRGGTRLVCIDPVRSSTAKFCDEWISLRPGSDGALALAMLREIIDANLYDVQFLLEHTDMPFLLDAQSGALLREKDISRAGGEDALVWCKQTKRALPASGATMPQLHGDAQVQLLGGNSVKATTVFDLVNDLVSAYGLDAAEKITEVPAKTIKSLAHSYATAKPGAIRVGFGIDRWYNSDITARAIATLACFCGNIGIPGGGVGLISGGKSVPVSGRAFFAPDGKSPGFLSMMEIDEAVRTGHPYPIKMDCISLGNPFNQVKPNRAKVIKDYIGNLEFIVVIDHFMTDSAKYADLVLPACTIFERTDIVVDRFVQLQQRVVAPEGEAKSDFEIFQAIAEKSGFGEYFSKSPEEYIDSMLESDDPVLADLDVERLKKEKVIYPWPSDAPYVGFSDRKFPTGSGRIEVYREELRQYGSQLPVYREPIEASPHSPMFKKYPMVLLSSHSRYRIHSTFANMPSTRRREPEPLVRLNPKDAHSRALENGDIARVFNDRGSVTIKCRLDEAIRPGCLLISEGHWIDQFIDGDPYGLTHDELSPTSENYAHYDVLVDLCAA